MKRQEHKSLKGQLGLIGALSCVALMLSGLLGLSNTSAEAQSKNVSAQKSSTGPVGIIHVPPTADRLPYPGQDITLTLRLINTRETSYKVFGAVTRDGHFVQVYSRAPYLNEYDQPTYEISLPSPVAELRYRLIVVPPSGMPMITQPYVVRRDCIPNVSLGAAQIDSSVQGNQHLQNLVSQSKDLENDLAGYQHVFNLVDSLQKKVQTK